MHLELGGLLQPNYWGGANNGCPLAKYWGPRTPGPLTSLKWNQKDCEGKDLWNICVLSLKWKAVICNFWHPGTLMLRLSVRVPGCQKLQMTA